MTRPNCPDAQNDGIPKKVQRHSMIQGISIETEEKYKKEIINRCRQISAVLPSLNAFGESSNNLPDGFLLFAIADRLALATCILESFSQGMITSEALTNQVQDHVDVVKAKQDINDAFVLLNKSITTVKEIGMRLATNHSSNVQ